MQCLETLSDSWHYLPIVMFMIMLFIMTAFIFIIYRRRRYIFNGKWFRQNWSRDWFTNCYRTKTKETATEILKKRYVQGEISKEEFEQIKRDISSTD